MKKFYFKSQRLDVVKQALRDKKKEIQQLEQDMLELEYEKLMLTAGAVNVGDRFYTQNDEWQILKINKTTKPWIDVSMVVKKVIDFRQIGRQEVFRASDIEIRQRPVLKGKSKS